MKKRGSYLLLGIYIFLFGIVIISSIIFTQKISITGKGITGFAITNTHIITPTSFEFQEGDFEEYRIKIDNQDPEAKTNITRIEIFLNNSFTYLNYSNGTTALFDTFQNDSDVQIAYSSEYTTAFDEKNILLQWINSTAYLIKGGTSEEFWFSANASQAGDYIINITTHNKTGEFTSFYTFEIPVHIICRHNWIKHYTNCENNEKNITYYLDSNSCEREKTEDEQETYANTTSYCDKDENNLIGNFNSFTSLGTAPIVMVNDSLGDESKNYTGLQKIEFKEAGKTQIEFDWDFDDEKLNMYEIKITKQENNSNKGYLIINNLDVSKTVYIDKLNASSNSVCVKEAYVESINNITSACTGTNEKIIHCPGTNLGITCEISGDMYKVSGIDHSAITEFTDTNVTACTSSWNCSEWDECENGLQTRTCTDDNDCAIDKIENQTCGEECIPDWSCTQWTPLECPDTKEQTRTCTDDNDCGTTENKPNESKPCTPKKKTNWLFILLIILIAGAIIGVILLLIKMSKKAKESTGYTSPPVAPSTPKPPFSPSSPPPRLPQILPRPIMPPTPKFPPASTGLPPPVQNNQQRFSQ